MKSLYIIPFLLVSLSFYAQEQKPSETQDQEKVLKDAKAFEQKIKKESELNSAKNEKQTTLASEQDFNLKQQDNKPKNQNQNSDQGKLLPNTASFDEILASIPNRQMSRKVKVSSDKVQGLPNTATLEEIKKTIPKN